MSLRLLKKHLGDDTQQASDVAKSVVQPLKRSKGKGRGSSDRGSSDRGSCKWCDLGECWTHGKGGGRGEDPYFNDNSRSDDGPRVMAPKVSGRFHGSSVQAAHVAAAQKSTVQAAREKQKEWEDASELAVKSGLGLRNVEEKKRKEEEDKQAKREALRAKRKGEVVQREVDDLKALAECEEQAWCDSEANHRVKYEAALVVRMAIQFGASAVWTKIAEARSRGAELPLDTKKVFLLAHPDKCPLVEAADATAILNAQRPPDMTPNQTSAADAPAGELGSKAAVAARVAAARAGSEQHKIDPEDEQVCTFAQLLQKYTGVYTEDDLQGYWEVECKPLQGKVDEAPEQKLSELNQMPPREPVKQTLYPAAPVKAAADAEEDSLHKEEDGLQKVDPEDDQLCTFKELQAKYSGTYSLDELREYWNDECSFPAKLSGKIKDSLARKPPGFAAPEVHVEPAVSTLPTVRKPPGLAAPEVNAAPAVSTLPIVPETADVEEGVPGLAAWLKSMNLGSYSAAAKQWAEEQGAIGLDELVESLDDLAMDLKMKPLQVKRLKAEAESAASVVLSEPKAAPATVCDTPSVKRLATPPSKTSAPKASNRVDPTGEPPLSASSKCKEEKRIDPETGEAVTLQDLQRMYASKYTVQEIDEYWESCELANSASAEAQASVEAAPSKSSGPKVRSRAEPPAVAKSDSCVAAVSSTLPTSAPEEKRIDPETGQAVTLGDLFSLYGRKYSVQEVDEYWESCEPAGSGTASQCQDQVAPTAKQSGYPSRGPRGGKETGSVRDFLASKSRLRY